MHDILKVLLKLYLAPFILFVTHLAKYKPPDIGLKLCGILKKMLLM